jgi:hypothetical protein
MMDGWMDGLMDGWVDGWSMRKVVGREEAKAEESAQVGTY